LYYKIISYKIDYLKYLILLKITKGSVLKRVLLGSFLMYGVVFATVSDIFPDVLSSGSGINFNSKAEIEGSGEELMTPSMLNKNKAKCDGVFCQMSGEAPEALKSFKFLESNSKGKLEVTEDMTFLDSDLGSTEIKVIVKLSPFTSIEPKSESDRVKSAVISNFSLELDSKNLKLFKASGASPLI